MKQRLVFLVILFLSFGLLVNLGESSPVLDLWKDRLYDLKFFGPFKQALIKDMKFIPPRKRFINGFAADTFSDGFGDFSPV